MSPLQHEMAGPTYGRTREDRGPTNKRLTTKKAMHISCLVVIIWAGCALWTESHFNCGSHQMAQNIPNACQSNKSSSKKKKEII
jgi:hypothetical protein